MGLAWLTENLTEDLRAPLGIDPILSGPSLITSQLQLPLTHTTHSRYFSSDSRNTTQVTWNPPDCNGLDGSNTDDVRGLMPPAAWAHAPHGQPVEAAAAPSLLAVGVVL